MARQDSDKGLGGLEFDDVADDFNTNKNDNINNNSNNDIAVDPAEKIMEKTKSKDETHKFRGFYLETDVVKAIDRKVEFMKKQSNSKGKGMKSQLVNDVLKQYFKQTGYLK